VKIRYTVILQVFYNRAPWNFVEENFKGKKENNGSMENNGIMDWLHFLIQI
jgi:hypothetical protein